LKWAVERGYDRHQHPYLGLRGGLIGMGFQIYQVLPGSPAEKAGIRSGDRIQGIGNHTLCGIGWLADVLHLYPAGKPVTVRVVRKGDWIPENI
jgi:S1-C subfamily serine protease